MRADGKEKLSRFCSGFLPEQSYMAMRVVGIPSSSWLHHNDGINPVLFAWTESANPMNANSLEGLRLRQKLRRPDIDENQKRSHTRHVPSLIHFQDNARCCILHHTSPF
ncbi:uncharacterized protein HMPREF1120_01897 [Exophiala dermatitidis NIH/UT8656]|uniref:Uncharacterized protein n=1 Tax=Exophiala dermatitidis (strain ATCC 34100 / CBS 525.76 / NIH/UT8656) TaxID=858893 RepID=H6BPY9_EXODN|nr:uncharacterized protein HMPREF1120_01897 [Exophiala dermatitidis NIH/UT8656]EHY53712.1 hypothetical protein HMPREF1120_01897 [Exophiala dermatitidis NIH/UT8656]